MKYKDIRKLRELFIDELAQDVVVLLPEHYLVVEARIQTLIQAGVTLADVRGEQEGWKRLKTKQK